MHMGWGEFKGPGLEGPHPLSLDVLTFTPLPTNSLPADLGLLSCQKRTLMENVLLSTVIS